MTYLLLLPFALAPSFIWLAFYLRKDSHPEPNRMVLKVFFLGMLVTLPAIWVEAFFEGFFSGLFSSRTLMVFAHFLFGVALVEELLKYLVVRMAVFSNSALDEPLDVMLYMIIAGLGFAALENAFLLFGLIAKYPASDVFLVNMIRLVQAVLLHALASGLFGYFLALSFARSLASHTQFKQSSALFLAGLALATLLHGLFNFYIFTIGGAHIFFLLAPIVPLVIVGMFISSRFRRVKSLWTKLP